MDITRTNFKFLSGDENIQMVKGNTLSFGLQLLEADETLSNVELTSAYLTVKQNYTDSEFLLQKSIGDGITKTGTGEYAIRIAPDDTLDVEIGRYFYSFDIGIGDDVFTILKGVFEIEEDVRRN